MSTTEADCLQHILVVGSALHTMPVIDGRCMYWKVTQLRSPYLTVYYIYAQATLSIKVDKQVRAKKKRNLVVMSEGMHANHSPESQ